ncbi:hypothetical protein GN958_ATG10962 [Phytophthora infestans]|uniref:Uncharacterized protein n=1 Tax=Phytophthora infestans TaxID=4787 RepID=A0A8S9ULH2_PHYIN|nr:hypothetical protein GN958_ATG10962 [Phytophthora infestans]
MDEEKVQAYADLAAQMMELHASIALLSQNVEKMVHTDEEVTSMTRIFNGVYVQRTKRLPRRYCTNCHGADCRFKNAALQTNYREQSPSN